MKYWILLLLPIMIFAYTNAGTITPNDNCGAPPRYRSCGRCHFSGPSGTDAWFEGLPDNYSPGVVYDIELHMSHPSLNRWGFQMVAKDRSNNVRGALIPVDDNTFVTSGGYLNQSFEGCFTGVTGEVVWEFQWEAPSSDRGEITFYAGVAACDNRDDEPGDHCLDISRSITYADGIFEDKEAIMPTFKPSEIVSMFDIRGKLCITGRFELIIDELENGVYFAKPADSEKQIKKICILK